jgi:hypothetical protein
MKFTKTCECCGHKLTAYVHKLNVPLASALIKLFEFYEVNKRRANLDKDLKLTYNQQSNFQKLKYWDLVHRNKDGWIPTQRGSAFIKGEIAILNAVASMNQEMLPYYHEAWKTHKKPLRIIYINDLVEYTYKQKEDYQEEKGFSQLNIFNYTA